MTYYSTSTVRSPLRYVGSKRRLAKAICQFMPAHRCYVEPFGGSAAVLLAKCVSPVEVYNDFDETLVNFFRVCRTDHARLVDALRLLPYARSTFETWKREPLSQVADPFERALRYFYLNRVSFGAMQQGAGVISFGFGAVASPSHAYARSIEFIPSFARRIMTTQVDNRHWSDVIDAYDRPGTVFYCYAPDTLVRTADERFVPIKDIRIGEVLFGGKTVLHKQSKPHNAEMVSLGIQGMPDRLCVTPEHQVLAIPARSHPRLELRTAEQRWEQRALKPAGDIVPGDILLVPLGGTESSVEWQWDDTSIKNGKRRSDIAFSPCPELWRLLGYFAAEGHIQYQDKKPVGVLLSFGSHEVDTWVADALRCIRRVFGVDAKVSIIGPNRSVAQVSIFSTSMAVFMHKYVFGKQPVRELHPDLMTGHHANQKELLMGWLRGDGGLERGDRNRTRILGTTASPVLARQMFTLGLRCGLRPTHGTRPGGSLSTVERVHGITFTGVDVAALGWDVKQNRADCSTRKIVHGHMMVRVTNVEREFYSGPVWDISVDGDHLFACPYALARNCDPPYWGAEQYYTASMKQEEHAQLAERLSRLQGQAMVSYYEGPEVEAMYGKGGLGWAKKTFKLASTIGKKNAGDKSGGTAYNPVATEVLYLSPAKHVTFDSLWAAPDEQVFEVDESEDPLDDSAEAGLGNAEAGPCSAGTLDGSAEAVPEELTLALS